MGEVDPWADIHPDLLNEVAKRFYKYDDYIRLRLVCKEWNSMLPNTPNYKRNPWLVLPDDGVDEKFDTHELEEEKIYHLTLPEMQGNIIRGSCHGWLIFVKISDGTVRMLNPFTKAHFDLPPISTFPDVKSINGNKYSRWDLRDIRGNSDYPVEITLLHKLEVWKVVISSPPDNDDDDFMAVAVYGECCRLAFCRRNDTRWRDIPTTEIEPDFQDVIFFQEMIYALDLDAQLYEFDTKSIPLPVGGISEAVASPPLIVDKRYNASMNKYLIGCANGNLLMLVKHLESRKQGSPYLSRRFEIFKLNRDAKEWSRVHSLENYVFMIGYNSSIQMLPHSFPNGKGDHVYYTDNQLELHSSEKASGQDIGILNLEDKKTKKLLLEAKFLCPPVWLSPSVL